MFSGKSEELIRRLRRAQIARLKVQIFKPAFDSRYANDHIVSHSEMRIESVIGADVAGAARHGGAGHRGGRDRRGTVLRRRAAGRVQRAGRTGASGSSWRGSTRTTSGGRSSRCRSCWRLPSTSPRRWRSAWSAATRRTTRSGWLPSTDRFLLGAQGTYEARCRRCFDPSLSGAPDEPEPGLPAVGGAARAAGLADDLRSAPLHLRRRLPRGQPPGRRAVPAGARPPRPRAAGVAAAAGRRSPRSSC